MTVTEATGADGGVLTVMVARPTTPSAVAEIVTEPGATAVIKPLAEIVASVGVTLDQTMGRPVSTLPVASSNVATAWVVWPAVSVDELTDTVIAATGSGGGSETVIVAELLWPAEEAVTVVVPFAFPVTTPNGETDAIAELATLQAKIVPAIGCPPALYPVATKVLV